MPNTNAQTIHQMGGAINSVLKQATGWNPVENIDMDFVTVAQNRHYEEVEVSGSVVSFNAGAAGLPFEKCTVHIKPVQDLHGYDRPWLAGDGKNKFDGTYLHAGLTTNGTIWYLINGEMRRTAAIHVLPNTQYTISKSGGDRFILAETPNEPESGTSAPVSLIINSSSNTPYTFTTRADTQYILFYCASNISDYPIDYVQLELGTAATSYAPYSNICPITGWDGVRIFVSPTTDAEDGQTYSITFPAEAGTVYGGELTINEDGTGSLTVDRVYYDGSTWTRYGASNGYVAYRISNLPLGRYIDDLQNEPISNAISIFGGFSSQNMTTNMIQPPRSNTQYAYLALKEGLDPQDISLSYLISNPQTYTLTAPQITTLLGQNYVWSDAGDIEVKFKDIKELY